MRGNRKKRRRQFPRRLLGYKKATVDQHLNRIDVTIDELRKVIDSRDADQAELVLRATRRSVVAVMTEANERAAQIIAAAEASVIDLDGSEPDSDIDLRAPAAPVESV